MSVPVIEDVDRAFFAERVAGFLPNRVIDGHAHIWESGHILPDGSYPARRSARWPSLVAETNPMQDLLETYRVLFPGIEVTPVVFGQPDTNIDLVANNASVSRDAGALGIPSLALTRPEWSDEAFERTILDGGFLGCKPYLNFAPADIPRDEIRIADFLPAHQLEVVNRHGWAVMLHIARPGRLGDPVNLVDLRELDERYPDAGIIVTHIGRAYSVEDVGGAMTTLAATRHLRYDITANTNAEVMRMLIDAVGPERILFGSDLPIFAMRARRINEAGAYLNLVPRGTYGDVSSDAELREVDDPTLSLLIYEEIAAFGAAAAAAGLGRADLDAVFYTNAARLYGIQEAIA